MRSCSAVRYLDNNWVISYNKHSLTIVAVVQYLSTIQLFVTPWMAACQASLSFTTPGVCPNSCPLSRWCYLNICSATLFFCPQSSPESESFPMSWLFDSSGQSIGASASASVLPMNSHWNVHWFPSGLTGLISFAVQGTLKCLLQHHS